MWQNLVLSGIGGWVARGIIPPVWKRWRSGQPLRAAITDQQNRDRRRVPRPTEMP